MNLRSPAFAILFSVSLIAAAGNMALQSVLPAIGREFRLSDTLVAGAFAISALMWTVASPFWARLSDRLGRKRVMMIGLGGFILSMSGFGLAATSGLEQWLGAGLAFILMGVARTIYGVFGSAAPIASQAYVADRTTPEQRTQAMSLLASAQGLGTVIGPALAPFFVLPLIGLAGPMYAFALFGLVVLVVVWRKLPSGEVVRVPSPSGHRGDAGKGLWKDPRVRGYLLYGLFVTGAQAANISVLGFHIIDELSATGIAVRDAQPFIGIAMLAGAARATGDGELAGTALAAIDALLEQQDSPRWRRQRTLIQGQAAWLAGDRDAAVRLLAPLWQEIAGQGMPIDRIEVGATLAGMHLARGESEAAAAVAGRLAPWLAEDWRVAALEEALAGEDAGRRRAARDLYRRLAGSRPPLPPW